MHHPPEQPGHRERDGGGHVVEAELVLDVEPEEGHARHAAEPVLPAREGRPAIDDGEDHRREGEGEEREVDAAPPEREEADHHPEGRREQRAQPHWQEHVAAQPVDLQQRRRIGGQPEEGSVTEGDEAGIAEQGVEAEPDQREDHDLGRDPVRHADRPHREGQDEERQREDRQGMAQAAGGAHSNRSNFSPIRPRIVLRSRAGLAK